MITKGTKTIVSRLIGKKQIVAIYKGTRLETIVLVPLVIIFVNII